MFDLRLRYSETSGFVRWQGNLAGLALRVVLIGLIAALGLTTPEVTAEIGHDYADVATNTPMSHQLLTFHGANKEWALRGLAFGVRVMVGSLDK